MNIEEKIQHLMSEIFKMDVNPLGGNITPKTVARWDSLAHIRLMLALECEFHIRIPDEQVVMLASFTDIADAVKHLSALV